MHKTFVLIRLCLVKWKFYCYMALSFDIEEEKKSQANSMKRTKMKIYIDKKHEKLVALT